MDGYVFVFVQTPRILLVNYHTRAWLQEKWEHPKKKFCHSVFCKAHDINFSKKVLISALKKNPPFSGKD